jgi:rare lipoprotein A
MFLLRTKVVLAGLIGAAAVSPIDLAQAQQVGHASWYALYSRTASGEMMNPSALTAAHRSLPFGTKVVVENLANGRSVVVRINDRGPFIGGRVIDLSKAAANHIGMVHSGTARVRITTAGSTKTVEAKVASVNAAAKVDQGKSLAAKAAASEPSDAEPEQTANVAEAPEPRAIAKPTVRKVSSKKPVASKTRSSGTRVASKTRAKGTRTASNGRSAYARTRIAAAPKTQRTRSAAKRRNVAVVAQASPYAGFAPAALRAG